MRGEFNIKHQNNDQHDLASIFGLDSYSVKKKAAETDISDDLDLVSVFKDDYNKVDNTANNSNEKDASADPKLSDCDSIQLPLAPHSTDKKAPKLWLWNPMLTRLRI